MPRKFQLTNQGELTDRNSLRSLGWYFCQTKKVWIITVQDAPNSPALRDSYYFGVRFKEVPIDKP